MKKYMLILLFFFGFNSLLAQNKNENEIEIKGIYKGETLYIQNDNNPSGVGFCITEITVNGNTSTDEINSNSFGIELSEYNLNLGDPVTIVIKYRAGCSPAILNEQDLMPESTFNIESMVIEDEALVWKTTNEMGALRFYVEQFKWNKWVRVGTIMGVGTSEINNYSVKVLFTSGENKFRVKQIDYTQKPRISKVISYKSSVEVVTFEPGDGGKTSKDIIFSANTYYEIYDYYGNLKNKGYSYRVDVSKYEKGTYFLNYDNKTAYFEKK